MNIRYLFNDIGWFQFCQRRRDNLKTSLNSLSELALKSQDDNAIAQELVGRAKITVPTIDWTKVQTESKEVDINLGDIPGTMAHYRGQDVSRKGIEFQVTVPFDGDAQLFDVQPESYSLNPPYVAAVRSEHLLFTYSGPQADVDAWTRTFNDSKQKIESYLVNLRNSADRFNRELEPIIRSTLQERRSRLEKAGTDLDAFRARLANRS